MRAALHAKLGEFFNIESLQMFEVQNEKCYVSQQY